MKHSTQITQLLTCALAAMSCPVMAQTSFPGPWWNPVASDSSFNTGMGYEVLINTISSGTSNTAIGYEAMVGNFTGSNNTATGFEALATNTAGTENTASGIDALFSNTTGNYNTAVGGHALYHNVNGGDNVAIGQGALSANRSGVNNAATGNTALTNNTTGSFNTASGTDALLGNTTGGNNTAMGFQALYQNQAGNNNIAIGNYAGFNVNSGSDIGGSNNIDIGNSGAATDGLLANSGVIRIGTTGVQREVVIAGIENAKITGSAVYVTSGGRLGVLASSERYKTAIEPMGANTAGLAQLRPVTFKLRTDAEGTVQYGLIAEEVDKVYPELVIRDGNGRVDGVRYDELAPMLLNEMQKEQATVVAQTAEIRDLEAQVVAQADQLKNTRQQVAELNDLKEELRSALLNLQAKGQLVVRR